MTDPTPLRSTAAYAVYRTSARNSGRRFVYFVQAISGGPIKIGSAIDPAVRLTDLQCGNPEQLRVVGVIPGGGHKREHELHVLFAQSRIYREWFAPTPELLALIEREATPFECRWQKLSPDPAEVA